MRFRSRNSLAVVGCLAGALGLLAPAASASAATTGYGQCAVSPAGPPSATWQPEAATYCVGQSLNVPVTMADGTVLRANVYYPTNPTTGDAAPGPFPVILTQTPYGKDNGAYAAPYLGGFTGGEAPYLVQRGYLDVVADVRGTGDSGGQFGLLDPIQASDGVTLVHWAAKLPHSDGKVGTLGPSYLGINQLLTAAAIGPHSPLKAIFPIVPGNDLYRDIVFDGGLLDGEFTIAYEGLMAGLNGGDPPEEILTQTVGDPYDGNPGSTTTADYAPTPSAPASGSLAALAGVEADHSAALLSWQASLTANILTGGDDDYDEAYWQARNPRNILQSIVANGIPAYIVGGWYDVFQRGEPLDYAGLQNAYYGRPVGAPMPAGSPTTNRYQLLMGPWYHLTAGDGYNLNQLELEWFDRWLKGEHTPLATSQPMQLYELGADKWVGASHYPLEGTTDTTYYLGAGGTLGTAAPATAQAGDAIDYLGVSSPCDRSTDQWSAGAFALALEEIGQTDPCDTNDSTTQIGPGALTYTTAPLSKPMTIAGPIDATLYATSTRPNTEMIATLEDVSPTGTSTPLTAGALLGSLRAVDSTNSWYAPGGQPLLPYHPYTSASASPVPTGGKVTRFDIEVFPTFAQIPAGDRVRLTITTSDTPHLLPTPAQQLQLLGGRYTIEHSPGDGSFVELPLQGS